MHIKSLVEYIVTSLVEKPELVVISESHKDNKYIIDIQVSDQDVGKVIGKNGRTIKALRTLVSVIKPADMAMSIDIAK